MGCISASSHRIGGIDASSERIGGIYAESERVGGISAEVSLVCCINKGVFLKVKPKETQWIDIYMPVDYEIHTPLEWNIE